MAIAQHTFSQLGRAFATGEPKFASYSFIVNQLKKDFGAVLHGGTPAQDMWLARQAHTFIGSFGSFSWLISYLSDKNVRINMPFSRERNDTGWVTSCHFFIHNDPRITMWDISPKVGAVVVPMNYNAPDLMTHVQSGEFRECVAKRTEFDRPAC